MRAIFAHPNTWSPCLRLLKSMGYTVSINDDAHLWIANSPEASLRANNPVELLGLAKLHAGTPKDLTGDYWWNRDGNVDDLLEIIPSLRLDKQP